MADKSAAINQKKLKQCENHIHSVHANWNVMLINQIELLKHSILIATLNLNHQQGASNHTIITRCQFQQTFHDQCS